MHVLATAGARIVMMRLGVDNIFIHVVVGTLLGIGIPYLIALKLKGNKYFDILFKLP